jgi:hypothetical protein
MTTEQTQPKAPTQAGMRPTIEEKADQFLGDCRRLEAERDELLTTLRELLSAIRAKQHSIENFDEPTQDDCFNLVMAEEEAAKAIKKATGGQSQ